MTCWVWQVYVRLSERLNMNDHLMVLNVMLSKIAVNLKVYGACEDVIQQTLSLFQVRATPCLSISTQWVALPPIPCNPQSTRC